MENIGRNNLKSKQSEGVDKNILQSFLEIPKQRRQWKNGLTEGPHTLPLTPAPHDGTGAVDTVTGSSCSERGLAVACSLLPTPSMTCMPAGHPECHWGTIRCSWNSEMGRCAEMCMLGKHWPERGWGLDQENAEIQSPMMSAHTVHQSRGIRRAKWVL